VLDIREVVMDYLSFLDDLTFPWRQLDDTVGDLVPAQRNAMFDWLAAHGIPSDWITVATTVRQVRQFVAERSLKTTSDRP
jgi:hypothetical protein